MGRKNIYCVFDTETIGITKKWVYDLGAVITNKEGKLLYKKRWIIQEVMNIPNIADIAFYGEKIKTFYPQFTPVKFALAREEFRSMLKHFNVNIITAYNLNFDMHAIKETLEFTEIGNKFLNYPLTFFDLWNASCDTILKQKKFKEIAKKEQWITKSNNLQSSAEIAYKYITKNYNFVESHTALEDAIIEAKILQAVLKQKQRILKNQIIQNPWKKIQEVV